MEGQNKNQEQRRLSDFLLDSDDELLLETNKILTESPTVLNSDSKSDPGLGRLIRSALFGRKSKKSKKVVDKEKEDVMIQELSQKNSVSNSVTKPVNDTSQISLGMGIGLFLLLAKTNYEYEKMSELHKEMKTLLEEIKIEFENKIFSSASSDLCCNSSESSNQIKRENKLIINCDKMDQMEAELEIEFERMRFNFGEEGPSFSQEEQKTEMPEEWIDFCENLGAKLKQNDENGENEMDHDYRVCPYELERKLHKLMNQRQEERIKELESQLRNLERKLLEKDMR
ncbi:hypothetical protein LUZ60_017186 [Juncus effusus]|nr:hypothetical protein LUZ60_017186 [Juncus effusus]